MFVNINYEKISFSYFLFMFLNMYFLLKLICAILKVKKIKFITKFYYKTFLICKSFLLILGNISILLLKWETLYSMIELNEQTVCLIKIKVIFK